jgi:N-formylglutamate amidohydrolase
MNSFEPVLLHIPHASLTIPKDQLSGYLIDAEQIENELLLVTDRYTDELFKCYLAESLVFEVNRTVVDPERFREDHLEVMASRGMGAVYTHTSGGIRMRDVVDREPLLKKYYDPHHQQLNLWAEGAMKEFYRCLIVDCHSYPSSPLASDLDQSPIRPMFCVGTDENHTPPALTELVVSALESLASELFPELPPGFSEAVSVNRPYKGTLVPSNFYRREPRVTSIMIEVNRCLYMDEQTGEKLDSFDTIQGELSDLLYYVAKQWCLDEEEIWGEVPDEEAQKITREVILSCRTTAKPEDIFAAIEHCGGSMCAGLDDFLTSLVGGSSWKCRFAKFSLECRTWSLCDVIDDSINLVKEILEPLVVFDLAGVYLAGGLEYAETALWISVKGIGVAQISIVGGDEFQVRECIRGVFDDEKLKEWLDSSITEYVTSQDEPEDESD